MRYFTFYSLLFLFSIQAYSQQITGKIIDSEAVPIPGASIVVDNTTKGTTTNFDGEFTIDAKIGDQLVVSYIGMKTQRITVSNTEGLSITLVEDTTQLSEVIITAFGIKKETKALGYSVQKISSEAIERSGGNDVFKALQGSVAGLSISSTSGSAGGGSDIVLRGITSLDAGNDNQPLIIVDGSPINNDVVSGNVLPSEGTNSPSSAEQFAFSNRGMDINPDDIESVSVLKGGAATALYGIRAANGAILITTKKGLQGKPVITISNSVGFKNVSKTPELQDKYREGYEGEARLTLNPESATGYDKLGTTFWSWGPKYTDDPDNNFVFRNTFDDFFKTATTINNNVSISGGGNKTKYYFSAGNSNESGIVPNTDYNRLTLKTKINVDLYDNLGLQAAIAYTNSGGTRGNSGDKSIMSAMSYWSPSVDVNDYLLPDGSQKNYTGTITDNPRYFSEVSNLEDNVDRWIASATANWKIKPWANLTYTASIDQSHDKRERLVPPNLDTGSGVGGFITNEKIMSRTLNSNLLLTLTHDFSEDISSTLLLGNQVEQSKTDYGLIRGEGLYISDFRNLGNASELFQRSVVTQRRFIGAFGDLRFDFYNRFFVSVTGRNDWASTLPKENRSFFYPSASASFLFHDLIDSSKSTFSFGKIRASWSKVGKIPPVGVVGRFYFPNDYNGFVQSSSAGDLNLKPEISTEKEIGADLRFLNNRFRIDYTYYQANSVNQILPISIANSAGLSRYWRNAGEVKNTGHEVLVSADIIKNKNFKWTTSINWSANKGEVISLPDDLPAITFASSGFAGVVSQVRVGDAPGTLYGYKWRYENGQRYINEEGRPEIDLSEQVKVGNAFPDWVGNLGNTISYKNFTLSALLEYKKGGDLYDAGQRNGIRNGVLKITEQRDEDVVLEGVMDDGNGGFVTNTISTFIDQGYYRSSTQYNRASEILVQDASWLKLRNVSVSYSLPENALKAIKIKDLTFSVNGGNFLLWTPFRGFDPEGNQYSAGSNTYGFTGLNIPLTQNYSFGVKAKF